MPDKFVTLVIFSGFCLLLGSVILMLVEPVLFKRNKTNVLVVEDDKAQNEEICLLVKKAGYNPIPAYSGYQGFERLKEYRRGLGFVSPKIACILLDINMPDMSGLEFLQILRQEESWKFFKKYTPVVMITVHDTHENRTSSGDPASGMTAKFITKPFDVQEIEEVLGRIIEMNDNETLIEVAQERRYHHGSSIEDQEYQKNRSAYFRGEINASALGYLRVRSTQAEQDALSARKKYLSETSVERFKQQEDLFKKEYEDMRLKLKGL